MSGGRGEPPCEAGAFRRDALDYILAKEPPFSRHLIGSYPTDDLGSAMHFIDILRTAAKRWSVLGVTNEDVYVVVLRLFSYQPAPAFVIVVGTPTGKPPSGMRPVLFDI